MAIMIPSPAPAAAHRSPRARTHRAARFRPLVLRALPIIPASILIFALGASGASSPPSGRHAAPASATAASLASFPQPPATQTDAPARSLPPGMEDHELPIADLGISLSLIAIPGGVARLPPLPVSPAGAEPRASTETAVAPFYITSTEITWDLFDIYIYSLDQDDPTKPNDADAVTRPSKPYLPPDRGFGHAGYPAISMSYKGAREFCGWLSHKTGKKFRLPTVAEWTLAAAAGAPTDAPLPFDPGALGDYAWYSANSPDSTQAVAGKLPNAWGLHDTLGNVAEWADDATPEGVALGGSYLDPPEKVSLHARQKKLPAWQAADAQIPKSTWWLSNCTWVGFRVVCEPDAK